MSLLLDALKKAANDKEKSVQLGLSENRITQVKAAPDEIVPEQTDSVINVTTVKKVPKLQPVEAISTSQQQSVPTRASGLEVSEEINHTEPLTLELERNAEDELLLTEQVTVSGSAEHLAAESKTGVQGCDSTKPEQVIEECVASSVKVSTENKKINRADDERLAVKKLTVSDDALSLLINKTNRDEKRKKIIVTGALVFVSLLILMSGGLYYYTDMQEEIAAMERKHQIAMQQMRAKTNNEKTPEKTAIIRNLVSDAKLEEKVQYAKEQVAKTKKASSVSARSNLEAGKKISSTTSNTANNNKKNKAAPGDLTIRKTNKSDPIGESLDAAWLAYEGGNYVDAKQLYRKVLKVEHTNRDAQLGLGAIAVIEKDSTRARRIYSALLLQDPRDPIATAALAELNSNKESLTSDNNYLLALLEKNQDAPHLNFSVGNNYAQQKKWKSAQQYYFKAWQHDSNNADYLFNLAVSMDQLGKSQQAVKLYRDSLVKASNKQVSFSVAAVQKRINELSGL